MAGDDSDREVSTARPSTPDTGDSQALNRVWIYVLTLLAVLAMGCLAAWTFATHPPLGVSLAALFIMGMLAELLRSRVGTAITLSFTAIVLSAAVALCGPLGAAGVGFTSALVSRLPLPFIRRAFNAALYGLIGLSGGFAYFVFGGELLDGSEKSTSSLLLGVLLPLVGANIVMLTVNAPILAGVFVLTAGTTLRASLVTVTRSIWLTYLGYGVIAFLFVVLWDTEGLGPLSIVLVVAPLAIAQWSITQQNAEQEAHYRTVSTLVAAVEARDPSTRGRAERVAQVSEAIGQDLRLRPGQLQALRFAAALHNIGLIAPVAREESGNAELSAASIDRLLLHPNRGVEMIRHIEFLGESTAAIRHHHERWDGRGYPDRLAGEDIPILARILSVADVFVSLNSGRRQLAMSDAVDTLRARAGYQLDPHCVVALERVVLRGRLPEAAATVDWASEIDHDEVEISDRLANATMPAGA